jgi:hypothetical protein
MSLTVCGLTHSPDYARHLVAALRGKGVPAGRIAMIHPENLAHRETVTAGALVRQADRPCPVRVRRPPGHGLMSGVVGWTMGLTLAGWLGGLLVVLLPDLATALATAPLPWTAAASTLGGITGAILGLAIAELESSRYNDRVRDDGVVIAVRTADRQEAIDIDRLFADSACDSLAHVEDPVQEPKEAQEVPATGDLRTAYAS